LAFIDVDKNVNERFFYKGALDIINPQRGTVIDCEDYAKNGEFFLISHEAKVATARPVLYRILLNDTELNKEEIVRLTHNLCYNYFNFPGPIKVPMVCMYAHKIANYCQDNRILPNEGMAKLLHFL
jgi:aubergine-like protein